MDFVNLALKFLGSIWSFIVALVNFLISIITSLDKVFDYIISIVFEIPTILMTIFNYLPDFMQLGFLVITVSIVFVLVLKIIRLIRESLAK